MRVSLRLQFILKQNFSSLVNLRNQARYRAGVYKLRIDIPVLDGENGEKKEYTCSEQIQSLARPMPFIIF